MAKIHSIAYIIIGILISIFSYYIDKNIREGFALFIYIGLLMIIIGIIRLAAKGIKSKKAKKTSPPHKYHPISHTHTVYCPRCRVALRSVDNFCYNCGNRIIRYRR